MKIVSFETARTLKEVGYPQDKEDTVYLNNGETYTFDDENPLFRYVPNCCCDAPTYLDVWLWLWREKKNCIDIVSAHNYDALVHINGELKGFADPEEAVIAAIEYLVGNNLIK